MKAQSNPSPPQDSMTARTLSGLREKLCAALGLTGVDIVASTRLEAVIPPEDRRRVWAELADAGYRLPALGLSAPVFWLVACLVLVPLLVAVVLVKNWVVLFSLPELTLLARRLSRPLVIHPHKNLTVYEAALRLTHFRREDYKAGLWSAEEIGDKVRLIIAETFAIPFASIHGETRIVDLC